MINTRAQLIELFVTLNTLLEDKKINIKFEYAATKNIHKLEGDIQKLMFIESSIENLLKDYKKDYKEIVQKYGTLNENGKYQIDVESSTGKKVQLLIDKLNEDYKEVLDNYSLQEGKYRELLNGEVDFGLTLHKINISDLPTGINREQMRALISFDIIEE